MHLSKQKKTVIIGTGVVNLITAYFLAKEGHELVLIDKAPLSFITLQLERGRMYFWW